MRGLILAGGSGTRLQPTTLVTSKQLLPVYDKPMIYYPLSTLMLTGLRRICCITTPRDRPLFERLLGDGSHLGVEITWAEQAAPEGLAHAYIIGAEFIGEKPSCLILGDNLFYGYGLANRLRAAATAASSGARVFGYRVSDPERYGVVELDAEGRPLSLDEKPSRPRSHLAVPGLYFMDGRAPEYARSLKPSARGELEIIDLLRVYLARGELTVEQLGRGTAWLDTGTHESLLQAANFVEAVEQRQGLKIGCPEEVAYRMGYIDREQLLRLARGIETSSYGQYLLALADDPQ